jgi:hypothetical protein
MEWSLMKYSGNFSVFFPLHFTTILCTGYISNNNVTKLNDNLQINEDIFIRLLSQNLERWKFLPNFNMCVFHCTDNIQLIIDDNPCMFKHVWCDYSNGICDSIMLVLKISNKTSVCSVFHTAP